MSTKNILFIFERNFVLNHIKYFEFVLNLKSQSLLTLLVNKWPYRFKLSVLVNIYGKSFIGIMIYVNVLPGYN